MNQENWFRAAMCISLLIAIGTTIAAAFMIHLIAGLIVTSLWAFMFAAAARECVKDEEGKEKRQ